MKKIDAEQHSVVWGFADKHITEKMQEAQLKGLEGLTSTYLALSHFCVFMSSGYKALAESIKDA